MDNLDIYNTPIYGLKEVAKYVGLTPKKVRELTATTIRNKVSLQEPVIKIADNGLFSFNNLVELHTVSSLLPFKDITKEHLKKVKNILLTDIHNTQRFVDDVRKFLKESFFPYTLKVLVREALCNAAYRVQYKDNKLAQFLPVVIGRDLIEDGNVMCAVSIDPTIYYGKPCLAMFGIPTKPVADRYKAGESLGSLEEDYKLPGWGVEAAIIFELGSLKR